MSEPRDTGDTLIIPTSSDLTQDLQWGGVVNPCHPDSVVRTFDSGANRSAVEGKPQYSRYLSPVVLHRYGQYMLKHQQLPDGTTRPADNWQKGIPTQEYIDSLWRHMMDAWCHLKGQDQLMSSDYQEALCAMMFNIHGLLHEEMVGRTEVVK